MRPLLNQNNPVPSSWEPSLFNDCNIRRKRRMCPSNETFKMFYIAWWDSKKTFYKAIRGNREIRGQIKYKLESCSQYLGIFRVDLHHDSLRITVFLLSIARGTPFHCSTDHYQIVKILGMIRSRKLNPLTSLDGRLTVSEMASRVGITYSSA